MLNLFSRATYTNKSTTGSLTPHIPSKIILILAISLPIIFILTVVMAVVHCVGKRQRRKARQNAEARIPMAPATPTLRSPRLPFIAVTTDAPIRPVEAMLSQQNQNQNQNRSMQNVDLESPINSGRYQYPQPPVQIYDPATRRTIYWG